MALDWIKNIEKNLLELEEQPQVGLPQPFPLEKLQETLRKTFEKPTLTLQVKEKGWVDGRFLEGIGSPLKVLKILWPPIIKPIYWVMSEQDIAQLMLLLLGGKERDAPFLDPEHVQGFYDYMALEVLNSLSSMQFATLHLDKTNHNQTLDIQEPCYLIDVDILLEGRHFFGRLCITKSFRSEWKRHQSIAILPLSDEWRDKIMVDVSLEVGDSELTLSDWKKAKQGDFVLLDHCSYDPIEKTGSVLLAMEGKPLFRARVKEDGIKLSEYPTYEEVEKSMNNEKDRFNTEDDEDEKDLYGDLEEDEDFFANEPPPEQTPQSPPNHQASPPSQQKSNGQSQTEEKVQSERKWEEDLPVRLSVEVARIRMSASELMKLAPGNVLDLQVSPEQGVDIVLNGKKIGKGELIRMGETVGVRILSL